MSNQHLLWGFGSQEGRLESASALTNVKGPWLSRVHEPWVHQGCTMEFLEVTFGSFCCFSRAGYAPAKVVNRNGSEKLGGAWGHCVGPCHSWSLGTRSKKLGENKAHSVCFCGPGRPWAVSIQRQITNSCQAPLSCKPWPFHSGIHTLFAEASSPWTSPSLPSWSK